MAVLVDLASQSYAVGPQSFPVTVSAGVKSLFVSLTRESWPVGLVLSASIVWSDGEGCAVTVNGGIILDKGAATPTSTFLVTKQAGVTQGTVTVNVLQALTTAIQVVSA